MKVGDLVRWQQIPPLKQRFGCLPGTQMQEKRWAACGLVQEVCSNGNINVLWPDRGLEMVAKYFLEVISESR